MIILITNDLSLSYRILTVESLHLFTLYTDSRVHGVCIYSQTKSFCHSGACLMRLDRRGGVEVDSTVGDGTTVALAQGGPVATSGGEMAS